MLFPCLQEKVKIQNDIQVLSRRLAQVGHSSRFPTLPRARHLVHPPKLLLFVHMQINESLAKKMASRNEYDKVIQETEGAYVKILESSQTLLTVLKRETVNMTRRKQASS